MKRFHAYVFFFAVFLCLVVPLSTAQAAIVYSGDLDPGNPNDWDSETIAYVGYTDTTDPGQVEVNGGSDLVSLKVCLGFDSGTSGTVTVTGTGSTWDNDYHFTVGACGSGTLTITNGGAANGDSSSIGYEPGSTGVVTVDGVGSTWNNTYYLDIGISGSGTLSITNGGTVNSCDGYIGYESGSTGVVTVDGVGSTWNNADYLEVGGLDSGTLSITSGGLVKVAGTLNIDYDTNGDGLINISDGGMLALAGDADDSLAAFFDLIEGTDAVQWWDPEASGWNSLTSAVMGTDYTLEYFSAGDLAGYTLLTVTAIEPVPGDINCDGMVDSSDFAIMANNWQAGVSDGQTANWAMGDFNDDHMVDSSDFAIMANNWQSGVGLSLANVAVPEPGSVALLLSLVAVGMGIVMKKAFEPMV